MGIPLTVKEVLELTSHVVAAASVVAAVTPNQFDNRLLQFFRQMLDVIAFNYGFAANKERKL